MSVPDRRFDLRRLAGRSALIFAGRMIRAALGFLIGWLIARWLGPQDYGLYYLFIVTVIFGQAVLGEGFDPALVRYYAQIAPTDPHRARSVLSSALSLRLMVGVPLLLLTWGAVLWLGGERLGSPLYVLPISLGLAGALGAALWNYGLAVSQAREEFLAYFLLTPAVHMVLVVTVVGLLATGRLDIPTLLVVYVACYFVVTAALMWTRRELMLSAPPDLSLARELLGFGRWIVLANLLFMLQMNLPIPFLSFYSGPEAAGVFGAGLSLLLVVDHLMIAILTVQMPTVSRIADFSAARDYVRRSAPVYATIALVLTPLYLLAEPLVLGIYGDVFSQSVDVFKILLLGFLATLVSHPLYIIFYAMGRPYLYTIALLVSFCAWLIAAFALIPTGGVVGAAWTTLIGRIIQAVVIAFLLWVVLRGRRPREAF